MGRACRYPGCPAILPESGYCPRHRGQGERAERERWGRDRDRRDPAARKIYNGKRWRRLRQELLAADPICRRCRDALAVEVHHVRPIKVAPHLAHDPGNCRPLCRPCHEAEEAGAEPRAAERRDRARPSPQ